MSGYLHFYAKHPALQKVADALTTAGNGFHNTSEWVYPEDYFEGKSACDLVQAAFDEADKALASPPEAEGRDAVLEEAAKACEGDGTEEGPDTWDWHQKDYAKAIRSLKRKV
jgi:hypothetical protein